MGLLKSLFGDKDEGTDVLDHVDPATGFEHAWSDEQRYGFCVDALEQLKAQLGGELRMADDEMRLYTQWGGRPVVIGADWYTGNLVASIMGEYRLGPIGIMRDDSLDEAGEMSEEKPPAGWSEDTAAPGSVRQYVATGIYLEATPGELEYERQRLSAIPDALRTRIFDAMQNARLQSVFTSEEGLDFTWERTFFRERSLPEALGSHLDLGVAVFEIFALNSDPDPTSPDAKRCPHCRQKVVDLRLAKCDGCGGPL